MKYEQISNQDLCMIALVLLMDRNLLTQWPESGLEQNIKQELLKRITISYT